MSRNISLYLRDILENMRDAEAFIEAMSYDGFAADKKMLGWGIAQRREDRIDCANVCTGLWHNLFNLATL